MSELSKTFFLCYQKHPAAKVAFSVMMVEVEWKVRWSELVGQTGRARRKQVEEVETNARMGDGMVGVYL